MKVIDVVLGMRVRIGKKGTTGVVWEVDERLAGSRWRLKSVTSGRVIERAAKGFHPAVRASETGGPVFGTSDTTPLGPVNRAQEPTRQRYYMLSVLDVDDDDPEALREHLEYMRQRGTGEVFATERVPASEPSLDGVPTGDMAWQRSYIRHLAKRVAAADGRS